MSLNNQEQARTTRNDQEWPQKQLPTGRMASSFAVTCKIVRKDLSTWTAKQLNMEIDGDSTFDKSDLFIWGKYGIKTNLNILNSMMMFNFSFSDRKSPFWANFAEKVSV